jgi:hypothetical protein
MSNTETNTRDLRLLSTDEADAISGGWIFAAFVLVGAAAAGATAAILTAPEKARAPTLDLGGSSEDPGTKVQGTSRDSISGGGRPA